MWRSRRSGNNRPGNNANTDYRTPENFYVSHFIHFTYYPPKSCYNDRHVSTFTTDTIGIFLEKTTEKYPTHWTNSRIVSDKIHAIPFRTTVT